MKKIEITVYSIDELKTINNNAYEKVLNDTRDTLINDNFSFADDDAISTLKEKYGINATKSEIFYSISYCQGDGFSFINSNLLSYTRIKSKADDCNAFEKWIINNLSDKEMSLLLEYLNCNYNLSIIKQTHRYCHPYTCSIDYECFYSSDDDEIIDEINDFINKLCRKLFDNVYITICSDIENKLFHYYDVTEEEIVDFINNNNYCYDADGVMY